MLFHRFHLVLDICQLWLCIWVVIAGHIQKSLLLFLEVLLQLFECPIYSLVLLVNQVNLVHRWHLLIDQILALFFHLLDALKTLILLLSKLSELSHQLFDSAVFTFILTGLSLDLSECRHFSFYFLANLADLKCDLVVVALVSFLCKCDVRTVKSCLLLELINLFLQLGFKLFNNFGV